VAHLNKSLIDLSCLHLSLLKFSTIIRVNWTECFASNFDNKAHFDSYESHMTTTNCHLWFE